MTDIVFPNNNETEFIKTAEDLGIDSLCFVYEYSGSFSEKLEEVSELKKKTKIGLFVGAFCSEKQVQSAKRLADLILVKGVENNRQLVERGLADIIYELEAMQHRDFIYQKNSGLNHVLTEIAAKKELMVGLSFSFLINAEPKLRVKLMGRMMQNIRLSKKYKVTVAVASFAKVPEEMRSMTDLRSLFVCLGMEQGMAKAAMNAVSERIKENQDKKSPDYIGKGIRLLK